MLTEKDPVGKGNLRERLAEVLARGVVRGCDVTPRKPSGPTAIWLALGEADALSVMAEVDALLLIAAADNLIMPPTERAAAMLPLCQAALYTGGSDRKPFLYEVGRLLTAALPAIASLESWKVPCLLDSAMYLRDCVAAIARDRPDAWRIFYACLEKAYRTSWS